MRAWKRKAAHRRQQKKTETEFFSASEGREMKKQIDSAVRCIRQMDQEIEAIKGECHETEEKLTKLNKLAYYSETTMRIACGLAIIHALWKRW